VVPQPSLTPSNSHDSDDVTCSNDSTSNDFLVDVGETDIIADVLMSEGDEFYDALEVLTVTEPSVEVLNLPTAIFSDRHYDPKSQMIMMCLWEFN